MCAYEYTYMCIHIYLCAILACDWAFHGKKVLHICIYIHIYLCMYIHIYINKFSPKYEMYMHIYIQKQKYETCMYIYIQSLKYICICKIPIYLYPRVYTYIFIGDSSV